MLILNLMLKFLCWCWCLVDGRPQQGDSQLGGEDIITMREDIKILMLMLILILALNCLCWSWCRFWFWCFCCCWVDVDVYVDYDVFVDVDVNIGESGGQQDHGGHEEHEEVVQPALWHQQGYEQSRIFLHHANKHMAFKTTHNKDESLPQLMKSPQLIFSHKNS